MAKQIVGLDLGSFSVKAVVIERRRQDEFEVVQHIEKPLGLEDVTDPEGVRARQLDTLADLVQAGIFDGRDVATGMPGISAQLRSLQLPFSDTKKISAVLSGVLDAQLPLDVDELLLSWFLSDRPLAPHSSEDKSHDEFSVQVGYAQKVDITTLLKHLAQAKIDPRYLTMGAAALFEFYQRALGNKPAENALIVDIGHTTTTFCATDGQQLLNGRSISRGGIDATRLIASRLNLAFADAQAKKHENSSFDLIKEAYAPILRETRQTISALRAHAGLEVNRLILVGGGSQPRDLDRWMQESLGVEVRDVNRVDRVHSVSAVPVSTLAVALGYGFYGLDTPKKTGRINFRKDQFVFKAKFGMSVSAYRPLGAWAAAIALLVLANGIIAFVASGQQLKTLSQKQQQLCQKVTGKKLESGSQCLQLMKEQIARANAGFTEHFSAADVYLSISRALAPETPTKVTELEISDKTVQVVGETSSFEAVDEIVKNLSSVPCFVSVEKGRARQIAAGIGFEIVAERDCQGQKQKV